MASSLRGIFEKILKKGSLHVSSPLGDRHFGDGGGRQVAIRFTDAEVEQEIATDPALKLAEAYMDGRILIEHGDIYEFLALIKDNTLSEALSPGMILRAAGRIVATRAKMRLPVNHNRRNVSHHYDLNARLFDLFLDEDWQYSCAYFNPPGIGLDEAQVAKKRHIAAKLRLEKGQRVLEIGSGWGGMAMYLAEAAGVDVTGITLSHEQLQVSQERAALRGLENRVRFEFQDYRYLAKRTYDRIVSVGMFEHVGPVNYRNFFHKAAQALDENGIMLLHSIGQPTPPLATNPFIEKYIFPGGYIPSLAEVMPAIEKSGLLVSDVEILPYHYAFTLRHWRERFTAHRAQAVALYDERFFRMWEFYLAGSEMAFTHENFFIMQWQLVRRRDAVPATRDYIGKAEEALKAFDATRPPLEKVVLPGTAPIVERRVREHAESG